MKQTKRDFFTFQIIPLRQSDIDVMVSNFRLLPDELRRNVPDLLISCMTTIFNQYKKVKSISGGGGHAAAHVSKTGGRDWQLAEFRDMAKSLITFAGMIPYRMPGDTNARLVQMEVLMN
jgi:nuclear pore complex protein Nup93